MLTLQKFAGISSRRPPTSGAPATGNDAYTTLLLHFDGANGSTIIADASAAAHAVTRAGNAQIATDQSVFGGASLRLDGSGDYLTLDGSGDFAFGTGDFTVDFWVRLNTLSGITSFYDGRPANGNGNYPRIAVTAAGELNYYTSSSTRIISSAGAMTSGGWYRVALVRAAGETKLYLDGVQVGATWTDSTNYLNGSARPIVGANGFSASLQHANAWLDELRVSKGIARWVGNFTPPTSPYG